MGTTSSTIRIGGADSDKVRRSSWLGHSVDGFIQVCKWTDKMHKVPSERIVGPANFVREHNDAPERIDCVSLVNNHVDIDTY